MTAATFCLGFGAATLFAAPADAQNSFYYGGSNPNSPAPANPSHAMNQSQGMTPRQATPANVPAGFHYNAPQAAPNQGQPSSSRRPRGYVVRPPADRPVDEAIPQFIPAPDAAPMQVTSNRGPARGAHGLPASAGVHKMSPEAAAQARAGVSAATPVQKPVAPTAGKQIAPASVEGPSLGEPGVVRTSAVESSPYAVRAAQYETPAPRSARKVIRSQPLEDAGSSVDQEPLPMLEPVTSDASGGAPEDEAPDPSSVDEVRPRKKLNCPSPDDFKKITDVNDEVAASGELFPDECGLGEHPFAPRCFMPLTYEWKASALCHKPLRFEEVALERYGHSRFPILQPAISGAFFLGSIPMIPYNMGLERPGECIYALGYYRPGSCAPYLRYRLPITARAVAFEAAAVVGIAALLP